jgi:ribosomal protein S18 acetylase RimI-like enzyme
MITIREFTREDGPSTRRIFLEGHKSLPEEIQKQSWFHYRNALDRDMGDIIGAYQAVPGNRFWIAESGSAIVGCMGVTLNEPPWAEICRLAIDPACRRQGIGRKMVEVGEAFAVSSGADAIRLYTLQEQLPARKLYESMGYQEFRRFDYHGLTVLHMTRELG